MKTTTTATDLWFTAATDLLAAYRSRTLSPVEVTTAVLERIERLNPKLNAYITVDGDGALRSARAAEAAYLAGNAGPLAGAPVSVKDLAPTKGLRTTYGSLAYRDFVPEEDGIAVGRLRAAGAVFLGKTNTPEFGSLPTNENRLGEPARNPWDLTRTPGGSSGGSAAAVAAGLGPIATGSDFGGSIRIPAAMCGVFGFKPTLGRVPIDTRFNLTGDYFSHEGPITRTVADAALFLETCAGPDARDRFSQHGAPPAFAAELDAAPARLRFAWSPDLGYREGDREYVAVCEQATRTFAESFGSLTRDQPAGAEEGITGWELAGALAGYDEERFAHRRAHANELTGIVRNGLDRPERTSVKEFFDAAARVRRWRRSMDLFFEQYDLLLTPTLPVPAIPIDARQLVINGETKPTIFGLINYTAPFNATGQPVASVPCGVTASGLPVGLQIAGRFGADLLVMQAARAFEQALPWDDRRPPIDS